MQEAVAWLIENTTKTLYGIPPLFMINNQELSFSGSKTSNQKRRVSCITATEAVLATVKATPPVTPGKMHMESWHHESLTSLETILMSASGYTNNEFATEWLQHVIHHIGSSRDSDFKNLTLRFS